MNLQTHISKTASRQKMSAGGFASRENRLERRTSARVWRRRSLKLASGKSLYNYFRDYDPATGRYVQSDPIGLSGGLSTYTYVASSPLTRLDRFGLDWGVWDEVMKILGFKKPLIPLTPKDGAEKLLKGLPAKIVGRGYGQECAKDCTKLKATRQSFDDNVLEKCLSLIPAPLLASEFANDVLFGCTEQCRINFPKECPCDEKTKGK